MYPWEMSILLELLSGNAGADSFGLAPEIILVHLKKSPERTAGQGTRMYVLTKNPKSFRTRLEALMKLTVRVPGHLPAQ